jgi:hypothetical protein
VAVRKGRLCTGCSSRKKAAKTQGVELVSCPGGCALLVLPGSFPCKRCRQRMRRDRFDGQTAAGQQHDDDDDNDVMETSEEDEDEDVYMADGEDFEMDEGDDEDEDEHEHEDGAGAGVVAVA